MFADLMIDVVLYGVNKKIFILRVLLSLCMALVRVRPDSR